MWGSRATRYIFLRIENSQIYLTFPVKPRVLSPLEMQISENNPDSNAIIRDGPTVEYAGLTD